MKQHTKIRVVAASVACLALFAALWKVSAPVRIKGQIERQARTQTHNVKDKNGNIFGDFRVQRVQYLLAPDQYLFYFYTDWYPHSTGEISPAESSCILHHVGMRYQTQCDIYDKSGKAVAKTLDLNIAG